MTFIQYHSKKPTIYLFFGKYGMEQCSFNDKNTLVMVIVVRLLHNYTSEGSEKITPKLQKILKGIHILLCIYLYFNMVNYHFTLAKKSLNLIYLLHMTLIL